MAKASWTWTDLSRSLRPDRARVLAAAAGGGLLAVMALIWPSESGVVLQSAERWSIVAALGVVGVGIGLLAASLAGGRRAALAAPLLSPAAVALALALVPRSGRIRVHVDDGWFWGVGLCAVGLALLLRSRARSVVVGALLAWVVGAGIVAWPPGAASKVAPGEGPDLLLLTLDTVRGDHFDFSSADVPTARTPFLSALAQDSVVFERAFSTAALTGPAHATMLSGQESPDHGARSNGDEVVAGLPWVPEILARQGWRTRALVSASVLDATVGFDRGFHDFDSTFERRRIRGHGLLSFLGFRPHKGSARHRPGAGTLALLDDLAPGHRTFTWIHLYDAHWPYEPGAEAAARHGLQDPTPLPAVLGGPFAGVREEQLTTALVDRGKRLYRAGIDELDQLVGALLATVPCDTTVVVVGDHGESLDEHGYHFSHGRYPYAPDARVPLLVRAAGWEPRSVETVVSLVDVAPTLLELAGLPAPPSMPGRSLAHPVERPAVTHCYATGFREPMDDDGDVEPEAGAALGPFGGIAVREGRWSAVQVRGRPTALFDRSVDPRELDPLPLPADHPLAVRLRAEAARTGEEPKELDEATREMLRALGYVE